MNKKRHRKHRESKSSNKKSSFYVALIWISAAVFSVLIALIIGNYLSNEADKLKSSKSVSAFSYTYEGTSVPQIEAPFINLSGQTNESLKATIDSLSDNITSVSLYLRQGDSAPSYISEVYNAIIKTSGDIDLKEIVALLHNNKIYVSACFDCDSFKIQHETARLADISFEAAMVAEAIHAGVDEVIILGLPVDDTGIAYSANLFSEIRKIKPSAVLGAALSYQDVLSDKGASALKSYSKFADFCALDTGNVQDEEKTSAEIADSLLYLFEVYPLRVLISVKGEHDFNSQKEALNAIGITNIQAYKNSDSNGVG